MKSLENLQNDMGYEIKLIIGQLNNKSFLEIARIDLSKIGHGPLSKLILFAKQKEISPEFKDWRFLNDVRGVHLGLDSKSSQSIILLKPNLAFSFKFAAIC
jgi:hypothetical protein